MKKLNLKLGKDIIITGYVDPQDPRLALLYASCDIFVLPSFHEGFSMTTIEAMAMGKPVVVSPIVGEKNPAVKDKKGCRVVDPSNRVEFRNVLIELLSNDKLRFEMGREASKQAQRYTWEKVTSSLCDTYKKL